MKNTITTLLLIISMGLWAQDPAAKAPTTEALTNLYSQLLVFPQEKVYVQTDRPLYLTGEKVYFRSYLIQASKLSPATFSRYVYVELVSPVDTVVVRQQIRMDDDKLFYGTLSIPETLPEGEYRLRAYTRYMQNLGEECFFTRSLYIADPKAVKLQPELRCDYSQKGQINVSLRCKDIATGQVRSPKEYFLTLGKIKSKEKTLLPNKEGWINNNFKWSAADSSRSLLLEYKDGGNTFKKYLQLPQQASKPELNFFPEGGSLVAGTSNRIAFKALMPGAEAVSLKGQVYNAQGELQSSFETQHQGMGSFVLQALEGQQYSARYEYNGLTIEVPLPAVSSKAMALHASWEEDSLAVSVRKPATLHVDTCYLLMHRQGVPTYLQAWDFNKAIQKWGKSSFKTGVTHIMLLNKHFAVLSERMVFVNRNDAPTVDASCNRASFGPRELVKMDINLPYAAADTVATTLSVAITDDKDVKIDTTTNIVAEILLSSELKGTIHQPAWYFTQGEQQAQAADLLMLTHGWRNYFVDQALQGKFQKPGSKPELSQTISGMLTKKSGRPYAGQQVQLTAIGCKFSETLVADENGRFQFTDFEFPDNTAYQLLSRTNEKTTDIEIVPHKAQFPAVTIPWRYAQAQIQTPEKTENFNEYVLKANLKYVMENGMRMVDLPQVTVKATNIATKTRIDNKIILASPKFWISQEELVENPPSSFENLFLRIPGVQDITDSVFFVAPRSNKIYNGAITAKIILNGVTEVPYANINEYVNINDIAQMDFYRGIPNTFARIDVPLILLTTWPAGSNRGIKEGPAKNFYTLLPLGYQLPVAFYSPKYDSPEALNTPKADLRSTIYWQPNLITEYGKAALQFYTADNAGTYSMVIEGIGPGKKLIYYRKNAVVKVNTDKTWK